MKLYLEKKMKIKLILILILITSCTSFSDVGKALRNEKTKTTDEFLIEKRGPLTAPPDMGKLPQPNSNKTSRVDNKYILINDSPKEKSRLENILLEEIKKN